MAILSFYFPKVEHYSLAALKLFEVEIMAQLLYGENHGFTLCSSRKGALMQVPQCVPNIALRLGLGITKTVAKIWIVFFFNN